MAAAAGLDVRALRPTEGRGPAKAAVDPWRPLGALLEEERTADHGVVPAATLFLAGAECPFTCVFCDLWRHTLAGPTPPGALPAQVEAALASLAIEEPARTLLKLYNASNFFEPRAVPPGDDRALATLARPFLRAVVESHARLLGRRALAFGELLDGRLEVAMGLETVHPEALPRLGKEMTVQDFDRAADLLRRAGLRLRAFVLVGAPFVPASEDAGWVARSAAHAFERGAGVVSLIPVRGGNGALEELARRGDWAPPGLGTLEEAFDASLGLGGCVVQADLWDLDRFSSCAQCLAARKERLARMNLSGSIEPRVACAVCGGR